jgi:hypothetical protein
LKSRAASPRTKQHSSRLEAGPLAEASAAGDYFLPPLPRPEEETEEMKTLRRAVSSEEAVD